MLSKLLKQESFLNNISNMHNTKTIFSSVKPVVMKPVFIEKLNNTFLVDC